MRKPHLFLIFLVLFITIVHQFEAHAATPGPIIKHLSSFLKWTRSSSKSSESDVNILQFEDGYLVETIVEGNELGVLPHSIRISQDGELFAVDALNSNVVRITPPLSQYSRARFVAGSFQGYTGHVDGKPSDARFNHPKGVTMDDKGNVYVADTSNLSIRKIGEGGVTTIAGGKSNVPGYRDGPSEHAMFSNDFDVVYVRSSCSLLVVDRGNAALRQISLNQEDCDYQDNSISGADVLMVIGAVFAGYMFSFLQQGFGPSFFSKTKQHSSLEEEKPNPIMETIKPEPDAVWPSLGRLVMDLSKFALEAISTLVLHFIPVYIKPSPPKDMITSLQDAPIIPTPSPPKQRPLSDYPVVEVPPKHSESRHSRVKSCSSKDPSLSSKHHSRRLESKELHNGVDVGGTYGQTRSRSQKERPRHRAKERSGSQDFSFGDARGETKGALEYDDPRFGFSNVGSKYRSYDSIRF